MTQTKPTVQLIPALADNYIYLIDCDDFAIVVDPAEAEPVRHQLRLTGKKLTHILLTHHHYDHVGGVEELKEEYGCIVVGPEDYRVPALDIPVYEGFPLIIEPFTIDILDVPGHTTSHIAYYFSKENWLFCGDLLFSCGIGGLFEGTPRQMWHSLQKLETLPDQTLVFCGHEYTQSNLEFAVAIEPKAKHVEQRYREVKMIRSEGKPTLPSTMLLERKLNPFIRCADPEFRKSLGIEKASPLEAFEYVIHLRCEF
jgi:hydroxyacylglutathione hydrolase